MSNRREREARPLQGSPAREPHSAPRWLNHRPGGAARSLATLHRRIVGVVARRVKSLTHLVRRCMSRGRADVAGRRREPEMLQKSHNSAAGLARRGRRADDGQSRPSRSLRPFVDRHLLEQGQWAGRWPRGLTLRAWTMKSPCKTSGLPVAPTRRVSTRAQRTRGARRRGGLRGACTARTGVGLRRRAGLVRQRRHRRLASDSGRAARTRRVRKTRRLRSQPEERPASQGRWSVKGFRWTR
jgi:hypothetical protein